MSSLIIAGTVLALCLYFPLCVQILSGKAEQNLATWILWGVIDGLVAVTLIVQHGNFLLLLAYVTGCAITSCCIAKSGRWQWTWFETFTSALVIACLIIWAMSGAKMATVVGTFATIIAGVPQLVEAYRKPQTNPVLIYAGYLVANVLVTLGGKDWSIEERFYPAVITLFCATFLIVGLRKFQRRPGWSEV